MVIGGEHKTNNKDRLFEMMNRVGGMKPLLNEQKVSPQQRSIIINDFIDFVLENLDIKDFDKTNINIITDNNYTQQNKSFASYNPNTYEIVVVDSNRNLADMLRSLAHEFVHHKQNLNNELHEKSGETGSEHENQANALAGSLMREYGKKNPKIFE